MNTWQVGWLGEKRMSGVSTGAEPRLVTPEAVIGTASGYSVGSGAVVENNNIISTKLVMLKNLTIQFQFRL